jgi:hypothetical protein
MAYVWNLTAANCPAVQDQGAALYVASENVTAAEQVTLGDSGTAGTPKLNRNATRLDIVGRFGGGAAGAIRQGLDITLVSGLTVKVSAGQAGIDSGTELAADTNEALADNVVSRLWLSRGGSIAVVTSASGTPLAPPDTSTVWAFLGAVSFTAGALDWIDRSGVLLVGLGNLIYRKTADAGVPGDTPPATVRFLTQTPRGLWLWDGAAWQGLDVKGSGAPEGAVTAPVGTFYRDVATGAGYLKTSGSGNTGWTQASPLNGAGLATVADVNAIGGVPVLHRIDVPAGATGNVDVTLTHKTRITDVWLVKRSAAGGGAGTIQVKNGTNAVTDAMSINVADQTVVRPVTIDDAQHEIAAGGTLRVARTRTASTDEACVVYVLGVRVA